MIAGMIKTPSSVNSAYKPPRRNDSKVTCAHFYTHGTWTSTPYVILLLTSCVIKRHSRSIITLRRSIYGLCCCRRIQEPTHLAKAYRRVGQRAVCMLSNSLTLHNQYRHLDSGKYVDGCIANYRSGKSKVLIRRRG